MRGGGSAITGAGAGAGGNPNGGSTSGGPGGGSGGGGGTNSQPTPFTPPDTTSNVPQTTCGAGTHIENGVCMPDGGKSVTPWDELVKTAEMLMKIAGIMTLAAMLLGMLAKKLMTVLPWGPAVAANLYMAAKWLSYGAAALFGAAAVLGLVIAIQHGQWMQGLIITGISGIMCYFAIRAADSFEADRAAAEAKAETIKDQAAKDLQRQFTGRDGGVFRNADGSVAGPGEGGTWTPDPAPAAPAPAPAPAPGSGPAPAPAPAPAPPPGSRACTGARPAPPSARPSWQPPANSQWPGEAAGYIPYQSGYPGPFG